MRDPAPPYRGEGEHALWHVSGDPAIALFRPHRAATAIADEPLVWATTDRDVERFVGGRLARVHAVEPPWDERMRRTPLYAYLLPEDGFEPYGPAGGYWISREIVELHRGAGIELRVLPRLLDLWEDGVSSTLEISGMRLRNARR